jgi:uncharacterized lipoprotein YmbA
MMCLRVLLAAAALAAMAPACSALSPQADNTKYFVLSPIGVKEPRPAPGLDLVVGVGPLTIPDQLEHQLVTRLSAEEIAISDTDRWGEPLHEGFSRALRQNLITLLGTQRVVTYPWAPSSPPDLTVEIEILEFERTASGTAELSARWSIERGRERERLLVNQTRVSTAIRRPDARAAVAALSASVAQLSRQIAADIRRSSPPP